MQFAYSKLEHELNGFLKRYLEDDSYDHLKERLDLPETKTDEITEKINAFYKTQLKIDNHRSKDRVRIDRIITFSEKTLQNEKFCKFLNELGHICLAEGKLDIAFEIFRKSNKLSSTDLLKAESYLGLADVFSRRANWSRSIEMISKAKHLFKSINDYSGLARCENLLGTIYGELGDVLKAKKYLLSSLSFISTEDDLELAANLYTNLGIVYNIQGSSDDSLNHLNKALNIYTKLGKHKNAAKVNLNIGLVHFDYGDNDAAINTFDKAIEISQEREYLSILCLVYLAKAQALLTQKDWQYASEFADKALEISHTADDKLTVADIYKVKGIIERELNNFTASETYFLNSLRINHSLNNEMNAAEVSIELGILYEKMDDKRSKKSHLKNSYKYFDKIGALAKASKVEELLNINTAS